MQTNTSLFMLFLIISELPPLMPADETPVYKQPKAVFGGGRVRRWKWIPFTNSARSDGLVLQHWRRKADAETEQDYYFARFNKVNPSPLMLFHIITP